MGYYTRVLSKRADCPTLGELQEAVEDERDDVRLERDEEETGDWTNLLLVHADGTEIASIERNVVVPGELGDDEIAEFLEEIADCQPSSAAAWLASYLPEVKVVYAFQHLSGTKQNQGDEALRLVSRAIWARGNAILQADYEGFTNEDGHHILWQFSDHASGPWWMAVRGDGDGDGDGWTRFQMELGDQTQRAAFLDGRVPEGAKRHSD